MEKARKIIWIHIGFITSSSKTIWNHRVFEFHDPKSYKFVHCPGAPGAREISYVGMKDRTMTDIRVTIVKLPLVWSLRKNPSCRLDWNKKKKLLFQKTDFADSLFFMLFLKLFIFLWLFECWFISIGWK